MMTKIRQRLNQKGFTLVELMVVIAILGVLAAIALPKFTDSTTTANTAKAQADLRTIDSAIVMYQAQEGSTPPDANDTDALVKANLLVEQPKPPVGDAYCTAAGAGKTKITIAKTDAYKISGGRAVLQGHTSDKFKKS